MSTASISGDLKGSVDDWKDDDYVESELSEAELSEDNDQQTGKKIKRVRLDFDRGRKKSAPKMNPTHAKAPENQDILLPSTLGLAACTDKLGKTMVEKEIKLRQGQANDALACITTALGEKSFLLRTKVRNSKSKKMKLKSWDLIHCTNQMIQRNQWVYDKARACLIALGADVENFPELQESDLRTITEVFQPNAPGQEKNQVKLSWIWTTGLGKNMKEGDCVEEGEYGAAVFRRRHLSHSAPCVDYGPANSTPYLLVTCSCPSYTVGRRVGDYQKGNGLGDSVLFVAQNPLGGCQRCNERCQKELHECGGIQMALSSTLC